MDIAALRRTAILAETTNRFKVTMNNGFLLGLECGNVKIIRKKASPIDSTRPIL